MRPPFLLLTGRPLAGPLPAAAHAARAVEEPRATTYRDGDNTYEEYRLKGHLYAVRVIPGQGTPYSPVRAGGDSHVARADSPNMHIPAWELLSW